jgi:hypothetical protein
MFLNNNTLKYTSLNISLTVTDKPQKKSGKQVPDSIK